MELVSLKRYEKGFIAAGWIGIICGLCPLLLLNITILTNMDMTSNLFYIWTVYLAAPFSIIAICSKKSRSLGFFGLSILLFITIFTACIFILGWIVIPFP